MKRVLLTLLCTAVMCGAAGVALAGPHDNADAVIALHMTGKVKNIGCASTQANPTANTLAVLPAAYVVNDSNGLSGIPCSGVGAACNDSWVWLMVANADQATGVAGLSCGVDWAFVDGAPYSAVQVAWSRCADLEFPSGGWPAPGGGNRITWANQTNCQRQQPTGTKVTACAGFFLVTGYGGYLVNHAWLRLTQNFNVPTPELAIADCNVVETQLAPSHAGWVGWNNGPCPGPNCQIPGCNPFNGPCEAPVPVEQTTWGRIKTLGSGE